MLLIGINEKKYIPISGYGRPQEMHVREAAFEAAKTKWKAEGQPMPRIGDVVLIHGWLFGSGLPSVYREAAVQNVAGTMAVNVDNGYSKEGTWIHPAVIVANLGPKTETPKKMPEPTGSGLIGQTGNQPESSVEKDADRLREHIDRASRRVESWPEWKRNILDDSLKPTLSEPRTPVDNGNASSDLY